MRGPKLNFGGVCRNDVTVPSRFAIDYESLLSTARLEGATNIALFLREHLPSRWRKLYVASVARPTNIVRLRCRSFEYLYDLYSQLEVTGEVPYDQTAKDRVVAVLGTSAPANKLRDVVEREIASAIRTSCSEPIATMDTS